jgi:hypothetical protein
MNSEEYQALADRAARRAVLDTKLADGTQWISDEDCKLLAPDEVVAVINAGRMQDVGPDKRIIRRRT